MADYITLKSFQPESAKQVYDALTAAKTAFYKEEDYLYVLDTNALLKTYSFDSDSFNKLKIFFESNKGKIFATRTIEIEYIRNRESVGNSYAVVSKKKFVEAFNEIGNTINSLYSNASFDYSYLMKDSKELCEKIKALHDNYKAVLNDVSNYENSISKDDAETFKMECFKMIVENVDFTTSLTKDQYVCLKKEYEELFKKSKDKNNKEFLPIFPGRGEKKQINEDGDYLIFHELLEIAKNKHKNIILLTNDVAKNDWVDKSGKTFEGYQIMFYAITGHSFIVHKYDDFLKDKVQIDSLLLQDTKVISEKSIEETETTIANVFFERYRLFEHSVRDFMNQQGEKDVAPPFFVRHYRKFLPNAQLFQKIDYVVLCRNAFAHPYNNMPAFDYNLALIYLDEIIECLPDMFNRIIANRLQQS